MYSFINERKKERERLRSKIQNTKK